MHLLALLPEAPARRTLSIGCAERWVRCASGCAGAPCGARRTCGPLPARWQVCAPVHTPGCGTGCGGGRGHRAMALPYPTFLLFSRVSPSRRGRKAVGRTHPGIFSRWRENKPCGSHTASGLCPLVRQQRNLSAAGQRSRARAVLQNRRRYLVQSPPHQTSLARPAVGPQPDMCLRLVLARRVPHLRRAEIAMQASGTAC